MKYTNKIVLAPALCIMLNSIFVQAKWYEKISNIGSNISTVVKETSKQLKQSLKQKGSDLTTRLTTDRIKNIASCGLSAAVITTAGIYQLKSISQLLKGLESEYERDEYGSFKCNEKGELKKIHKNELKEYGKFLARSAASWTVIVVALRSLQKNPVNPFK